MDLDLPCPRCSFRVWVRGLEKIPTKPLKVDFDLEPSQKSYPEPERGPSIFLILHILLPFLQVLGEPGAEKDLIWPY